jgi:hypothetical protein
MGQRDELKNLRPPRSIEFLIGLLIPRARREDVLGDMHERYRSQIAYAADAVTAVPAAILCQIRRATPAPFLLLEVLLVYASYLAGAVLMSWADGPPRLATVSRTTLVVLIGLLLHHAYADFPSKSRLKLIASVYQAIYFSGGTTYFWMLVTGNYHTVFLSILSENAGVFISSALISLLRIWIEMRRKDRPDTGAR